MQRDKGNGRILLGDNTNGGVVMLRPINLWRVGFRISTVLPFIVFAYTQCVHKVAVHLQKVQGVMSTSVYTDLKPFNFIRKHFLQICVRKVAMHL
jgi:hypothetical protein